MGEGGLGCICYSINNNKKIILKRLKKYSIGKYYFLKSQIITCLYKNKQKIIYKNIDHGIIYNIKTETIYLYINIGKIKL